MMCMKFVMGWGAAGFSLIAAVLWFCAGCVEAPYAWPTKPGERNDNAVMFTGDYGDKSKSIDVPMTDQKRTRWNKWAAIAAGIAAVCQSISLMP